MVKNAILKVIERRSSDKLFKTVSFILSMYLLAFQMSGNVSQYD